jgi:hypothetical protein
MTWRRGYKERGGGDVGAEPRKAGPELRKAGASAACQVAPLSSPSATLQALAPKTRTAASAHAAGAVQPLPSTPTCHSGCAPATCKQHYS